MINSSYPRLFSQHGIHILVWDGWHHLDIWVISFHPFFVHWNVLRIKQLGTWWILTCWLQTNVYINNPGSCCHIWISSYYSPKKHIHYRVKSYPVYGLMWNRSPWKFVLRRKGRNPLYWTCEYQIQNLDSLLSWPRIEEADWKWI